MRPIRATAPVLISLALVSGVGIAAPAGDDRTEPAVATAAVAIELHKGLAVSLGGRDRRAAISTDPVAAQVVAGRWT